MMTFADRCHRTHLCVPSDDLALWVEVVGYSAHSLLHAQPLDAVLTRRVTRKVQLGARMEEHNHHATRGRLWGFLHRFGSRFEYTYGWNQAIAWDVSGGRGRDSLFIGNICVTNTNTFISGKNPYTIRTYISTSK